ncbi:hypothetical protein HPU229336_08185 [Helicobacter pullorum]|uniref:Uncharacterized protein n=1 Tax=Helicobacter pullorum TaxID=35818 RepID=A0A0N0LRI9_9HELI|nr:hypothetical protein HPU229336_08185 [Helicobacter pullorum]KPH56263.1 hypothetical protein HPU229334_02395 [Helicobacter pullorum]
MVIYLVFALQQKSSKGLKTWDINHALFAADWACNDRMYCYILGRLLPHLFTLTIIGGLFSVALSLRLL